ncbi:SusD family protein [Mariniflexile rhizosphaerae]|uniref:RagB/SusD family nutrient uptake outer membrane protein n=1 Tax=unclassified Mariniflexile TaxID=2643887 RepID=UPI000CBF4F3F|nr:RagB/SusD family nutrient uptake outer membrane protein [Mariniflexile sp. TRM1-10]AXP82109.1 SusD family protein [Mariniflexile sp. TRM1-10]PLB20248.1 MAG: RagB/SusD domain protein [Flavobacteriaceae bacterium FS1-H7996/R]
MKTYLRQLIITISIVTLYTSCSDQLNLEPISDIGANEFYQNTEEINLAVVGIYNSMQNMLDKEFVLTELRSDNTYMSPRNSETANVPYRQVDRFVLTSQNIFVEDYWRACYRTISLANNVITQIDVVEDQELADKYEAEARFFRAHAYFNLVRLWGGVFIVDKPISGEEAKTIDRSNVQDVYDFLLADLEFASNNLPNTATGQDLGRLTKWAAKTELGKAYLTLGGHSNLTKAETVLSEVVYDSPFSYLPSYANVFDISNEYNNEILFAVRYQTGSVGLGAPFANYFAPIQSDNYVVTGSGDELNVPATSMSNAYPLGDDRKDASMADSWVGFQGQVNEYRYIKKYNSDFGTVDDAGNDWPVIRFTDAMLLLAEAINESSGPTADAMDLLNQVHERAGLTAYDAGEIGTYFDFKLALELERKLEFAFENQRWFDLLRTGRAVTVMNTQFATEDQYNDPNRPQFKTEPIQEFQLLLPIPQYEIDLNPSIAQNIGY